MAIFEPIFRALNASGAPYVIVGGVAVVLHGHARLTVDVDVVVDLAPDNAAAAFHALEGIGFRPSVPVTAEGFADPAERRRWIDDKNMTVLSMIDPDDALRRVDLFVESPIPFDELWARSLEVPLGDLSVHVAAIDDLIPLEKSGWDANRREQLLATLATTPARRLAWLEEAILFARKAGAIPPAPAPTAEKAH